MGNNIQKIIHEFSQIAPKLSNEDRLLAAIEFKVHTNTIARYISGDVRKEAFSLELLAFFKKIVAEREKALS